MIPGYLYLPIFLSITIMCSLYAIAKYFKYDGVQSLTDNPYGAFVLSVLMTVFIGFRPIDPCFADTVGYAFYIDSIGTGDFALLGQYENLVFDNLIYFFARTGLGYNTFFLFIASIYFIGTYYACRKLFPKNTYAAYLIFLVAFSTYSYSVNGIKAGAAASIFLCAIAVNDRRKLSWGLAILSWTFHHSMFVCVIAYLIVSIYRKPKWYFIFWGFCLVMSALHITYFQNLFSFLSDNKGSTYLDMSNMAGWDGRTGFRLDFVLYSFMPILLGWYMKYKIKITSLKYELILSLYLLLNGIWLLCMYAGFTNRIAYLSWFLYPFLLAYPFVGCDISYRKKYKTFAGVMFFHMSFTVLTFVTGQYH